MKRMLLSSSLLLYVLVLSAQLKEDFTPNPTGWILSQGASFGQVTGNDLVVTPGVGGNNPANIGTPKVNKTSNTFEVCMDIWAYTANLNNKSSFPCQSYMDVLFVKSTVTSSNDATDPANILARINDHPIPMAGGNTCLTFTFPPGVTDADFKVFLSFHAPCNQQNVKYVIDNVNISGIDDLCPGASCAPTAIDDKFVRANPVEMSFNAVLYGSNLSYPLPPSGYEADLTGTDNDQDDNYANLKWTLITPPTNGTVFLSPDGSATITRNHPTVTQVTFTYQLCDDGDDNNPLTTADNLCSEATVTANFSIGILTPVSLVHYSASRSGSYVSVKWTTTYENNNKGFELQRSIGDGNYETIGWIASKSQAGNSAVPLSYEYRDLNSTTQTSMYRLVQTDKDGTNKIHGIKTVTGESASGKIQVYPNPSHNGQVTISLGNTNVKDISIVNVQGKTIKTWNSFRNENLSITNLDAGMYVVQVLDKSNGTKRSEKILVVQ